jgi:TRAP-type mannitol/chloroaromatic compound transport system substrate-binding protein
MNKAAFEQAWKEVLEEQSAADPTFKKVADSYLAFRKVYKTWGDAQALKATYLSK